MLVTYRQWTTADDLSALTRLLNRAYRDLAAMGFRYTATWQGDDITARRIARGECWLAVDETGTYLGTVTYYGPSSEKPKECAYYQRAGLATFGQYGVDPEAKGQGIGRELMAIVERRACEDAAVELACDTAEGAAT